MDDTLLKGRTIFFFAERKGFIDELISVITTDKQSYEKSIEIAKLLKGMNRKELLEIFREIPLQKHVKKLIIELKRKNIKTGIVTNSYQFVADDLRERLDMDYVFANNLIIREDIVTGELILHNSMKKRCDDGKIYSICKGLVLEQLCDELDIKPSEVIAIGDSMVDVGMIKKAGLGVAFNASKKVQKYADVVTDNFRTILDYI